MYQYKVVPAPKIVKGSPAAFFQDLINREVQGGWKYVGMQSIKQSAGCFLSPTVIEENMLIFQFKSQ